MTKAEIVAALLGFSVAPDGRRLVSSYHCSRYNTQTRRLTPEMFESVFTKIQSQE